ncbi:MAG TPA: acetyl-CoA carboxylase biotin carboxylase subunit [Chloroflexota bacterium]|nr:acetyl-CoA carboxylase biotin carboxylase subunit [Chloroflexota bacterium]
MPLFTKVLIANRGEIAVRVAQTCAELGIRTVAIYSDADKDALHVRRCDEAVHIGPPAAPESYLNIDRIVRSARDTGADAVHPGYGFLSEDARFADACRDAGVSFVGPSPEAMRRLGSKRGAKRLARAAGVPVVPGYDGDDTSPERLTREAEGIGFPLLIKASAGGGGKGMRAVSSPADFSDALESARREAMAAFGDDVVLLEKLIERPRHVEIQILADAHGNVTHLGERDCTVQRRHQKVIEESPSPALDAARREEMGHAAVALVRAAGYVNAGTVEFVVAPDGAYYFLEVNTRLQVEHPVTELVTGLDLVAEQLRIAAGEPLSVRQQDVRLRGHAIECRVYAEDAAQGYLPSTGTLTRFAPPLGAGIRNDAGVRAGSEVTPYYDAMLAKLIVHAPTRDAAIGRALFALRRYAVGGVTTNLPLLTAIVDSPEFRSGDVSTRFLDERLKQLLEHAPEPHVIDEPPPATVPPIDYNPWRGGRAVSPRARRRGGLRVDDVARVGGEASAAGGRVTAPLTGTVVKVGAKEGESVAAGQTVFVLEAMKMEIAVEAPRAGRLTRIACAPGDLVQRGTVLAEIGE